MPSECDKYVKVNPLKPPTVTPTLHNKAKAGLMVFLLPTVKPMKSCNSGFTLIELVVVIVILGILVATALPKFVDLTSDATRAKVGAMAGAFQTAISLGNAVWGVKAGGAYMNDVPGYSDGTVDFNAQGFPVDTSFGPTSGLPFIAGSGLSCVRLWSSILVSPPTVGTAASGTEWRA